MYIKLLYKTFWALHFPLCCVCCLLSTWVIKLLSITFEYTLFSKVHSNTVKKQTNCRTNMHLVAFVYKQLHCWMYSQYILNIQYLVRSYTQYIFPSTSGIYHSVNVIIKLDPLNSGNSIYQSVFVAGSFCNHVCVAAFLLAANISVFSRYLSSAKIWASLLPK